MTFYCRYVVVSCAVENGAAAGQFIDMKGDNDLEVSSLVRVVSLDSFTSK